MSVINDGTGSKYFMGRKRVMGTIYSNLLMTSKCHVLQLLLNILFVFRSNKESLRQQIQSPELQLCLSSNNSILYDIAISHTKLLKVSFRQVYSVII